MTPHAAAQERAQGAEAVWTCQRCGESLEGACTPLQAKCDIGPEIVIHRLEAAGATLLAMRTRSPYPGLYRCALPDVLRDVYDTWDWIELPGGTWDTPPPAPSAAAVTAMDRTWQWLGLIPDARRVVRRIVGARALVSPATGRHLIHWRAVGKLLHCSHEAARTWHGQGIALIVERLRAA